MASNVNVSVDSQLPPKPVRKPGNVKVVRALYDYTAQHPDELSFEEGQLLYIYDLNDDCNWWKAKCGDKSGLIPSNYVEDQMEEMALPLHEAARRGNISFLQDCLMQGVSATGLDSAGNTPLFWAARSGHTDCVAELLKLPNSTINARNKMGDTALHISAIHGHLDVVNLLLEHGADTSLMNKERHLPEDLASNFSIKNALQMNARMFENNSKYWYGINDYNDDSD